MVLQMEDVRSRLLPRDLELLLLVGGAVQSLYLADAGKSLEEGDITALRACVDRLRDGVAELGPEARTLGQSADAFDMVRAAQRALDPADDGALRAGLAGLADDLAALIDGGEGPYADVAERLTGLHDALAEATATPVEGASARYAEQSRYR